MKYGSQILLIALSLFLMVGYFNCSTSDLGYEAPLSSSDDGDDDCSYCDGEVDPDYGQVSLSIGSADPIVVERGDIGVNVGGDCFDGNYPDNEIRWQLFEINGSNPHYSTSSHECENGRFHFLVQFPGNFDDEATHTLDVELIVYNDDGSSELPVITSINLVVVDPPD